MQRVPRVGPNIHIGPRPPRRGPNIHIGPRPPRIQIQAGRRPVVPAGRGEKNNDRIRVRNRRYKIKRMTDQARNINVRHNGRIVRRMVVRRQTIFPSARGRRGGGPRVY